jgi:DNA-binding protein YbaB
MPDISDIAKQAAEAKARLQRVASTVTSKDGAATVTVNASGALQQLTFGPKADEIPREQLAASVLASAHRAQAQAAQQLTAVMAPLIGTDSDAMKFLEEQIPASPAPPAPSAPPRPAEPRSADKENDGDDDGPIMQRGW